MTNKNITSRIILPEKPKIELEPLEKTAVRIKSLADYFEIKIIYHLGGWEWYDGTSLLEPDNFWNKNNFCMGAGHYHGGSESGLIARHKKSFYEAHNWNIITQTRFYEIQGLSENKIKEAMNWAKEKGVLQNLILHHPNL